MTERTAQTTEAAATPLHMIDLIRKKRDGARMTAAEIQFFVHGSARGIFPPEQIAAWLMAAWLRGLTREETYSLTVAMRDSGEKFNPAHLGRIAVDKHSTGGVGDKTSFLVAPIAAACGVAVPMISGRSLGHTGGTLDKLESIPGFRTAMSLPEFERVLESCGCSIISQTPNIVPADRVLYALRDRTATVESPSLICASILSKKLAAGLNGLVLDVKTGSGAFMRRQEDAEFLAALLVTTAEACGVRTVAMLTDMGQPLGRMAGNWIELIESMQLLRGERPQGSEPLRALSLILAGWMIHLGGRADTPHDGMLKAEAVLEDGTAGRIFLRMVEAQGGDARVFDQMHSFHRPGARRTIEAWESGYIARMDTTQLGWAVQRLGAGRVRASEPVDPHAGIEFHAHRGDWVEKGQPLATLFATRPGLFPEPEELVRTAIRLAPQAPRAVELVSRVWTRTNSEALLRDGIR